MADSDFRSSRDPGSRIRESDAAALWRRAAELQEEEARRAEERDRDSALQRALGGEGDARLSLDEIKAAAESAGIPAEYVEMAWVERSFGAGDDAEGSRSERAMHRFLGTDQKRLEVRRTYNASLDTVLDAMARVFPHAPFGLRLEATEKISSEGTELFVFVVPGQFDGGLSSPFGGFATAMAWADLKKLIVSLRSLDDGAATEVKIGSPLGYSRKLSYGLGLGISSALALGGGLLGVLGSVAILGGAIAGGAALAPLGVAAAGLSGAAGGRILTERGWQRLYAVGLRKGREGLEQLLSAITLHLRTDGAFLPGPGGQAPGEIDTSPGRRLSRS
jgi:hypothetical protein